MPHNQQPTSSVHFVSNFQDLVSTSFHGTTNAISWSRDVSGDFEEIVNSFDFEGNMIEVDEEDLMGLTLSEAGQIARETLLSDFKLLTEHGALPVLNIIKAYESDETSFFPTDVYSFHVDRSPIATDTFLCTYYGDASELIPNEYAIQKIQIPEIRQQLQQVAKDENSDFEAFLKENFYDLHYTALQSTAITQAGVGHLWRLAVDHPESKVLPCVHRAPREGSGKKRLLMIC